MGGRGGGMVERIIDHCILCGNVIKATIFICQCRCDKKCLPMSCIRALSLLVLLEWVATDTVLSCYIVIQLSLLSGTLLHTASIHFLTFSIAASVILGLETLSDYGASNHSNQDVLS